MNTLELKSTIHKLVDTIESEQFLQTVHDFLKSRQTDNGVWSSLTAEQKEEVLLAFEESENEDNLIDSRLLFKRNKWGFSLRNEPTKVIPKLKIIYAKNGVNR